MPIITNSTTYWWIPNVVVSHLSEGVEAVHLASGRTVCKVRIKWRSHCIRIGEFHMLMPLTNNLIDISELREIAFVL